MLNLDYLRESLIIAVALSTITCAFIQKTKCCFKSSKYLSLYSLLVNIFVGIVFCYTFTEITFPNSLWIGLFSFIGADTIYKTLEGKMSSYGEITSKKKIYILKENIINNKGVEE